MRSTPVFTGIILVVACWMQWKGNRGLPVAHPPDNVKEEMSTDPRAVPPDPQQVASDDATSAEGVRLR